MRSAFAVTFAFALLVTAAASTGCDLEPRTTTNVAADRWNQIGPGLRARVAELRSRQTVIGGRIGALTLPPGAEDPQLAQTIADLQTRLSALEPVLTDLERATHTAVAEVEAALAAPDRVRARRVVDDASTRLDQVYARALTVFNEVEERLPAVEAAVQRHLIGAQAQQQRFERVATAGGVLELPEIQFAGDTAQLDVGPVASKAALDRLARLVSACPEIRLTIRAHVSRADTGAAAMLARARADAVRTYVVNSAVPGERMSVAAAQAGEAGGKDSIAIDVTTPCAPTAAAPRPAR